jgi:hypothetical protein
MTLDAFVRRSRSFSAAIPRFGAAGFALARAVAGMGAGTARTHARPRGTRRSPSTGTPPCSPTSRGERRDDPRRVEPAPGPRPERAARPDAPARRRPLRQEDTGA